MVVLSIRKTAERKISSVARCYVRNGVRGWTVQEQLDALQKAGKLEDPERAHQDILPDVRAKHPGRVRAEWLVARNKDLLRPSSRRTEEIAVASPVVLGVSQADLAGVLARAWDRNATVFFADSELTFPPDAGVAGVNAAMADWQRARDAVRDTSGRRAGYLAAAEKKRDTTRRKLRIVRPLWMSTKPDRMSVVQIAAKAELSTKTIYRAVEERQLPHRPRIKRGR